MLVVASVGWAQASQEIYGDGLVNGWQNWSWATVDLGNGSPVHSGSASVRVTADAWEAIYLHHDAFASGGYSDLVFWIHGGSSGGQLLIVQALLDGAPQTAVTLPSLAPNTWHRITISLATLGVADKPNVDGFWIQDRSGTTKPAFYVDDVSLTEVPPPVVVNVVVESGHPLRTVDARHFGVNAGTWDAVFDTPTTIDLLTCWPSTRVPRSPSRLGSHSRSMRRAERSMSTPMASRKTKPPAPASAPPTSPGPS